VIAAMFVLAAATWSAAPDRIPVHWDLAGRVDRYGGKFEGLLLMPLLTLGIYLLFLVAPRFDPGRANYTRFWRPYWIMRLAVVVLALIYGFILLWTWGIQLDVWTVVPILVGGLFVVLGSVMGKIRPTGSSASAPRGRSQASSRGRRPTASVGGCSYSWGSRYSPLGSWVRPGAFCSASRS
jgi:uncharacterized membrane protein